MTPASIPITYVMGVHNSATTIANTVQRVVRRLADHPGSEIILVENGSHDESGEVCRRLAAAAGTASVDVVATTSSKGLGFAFRRGMTLARGELVILTADDLPFGFSDLEQWLALATPSPLVIGSKGHPDSIVHAPAHRRVMSIAFGLLRRLTLGIKVADSQGTLLLDGQLSARILPRLRCGDYLISTEVVAWAVRLGITPVEVAVNYMRPTRTTVSPLRDAVRMAVGMIRLRGRIRHSTGG